MVSIVTGTLNRIGFLQGLVENTVNVCSKLELVLVDGGSTDGTIDYIKTLNNPNIKLVEVGKRSTYPEFMNLGIKNSKYDYVCQWNDDVILLNSWDSVISEIQERYDFYLFNWKYGTYSAINNPEWISGYNQKDGWCLLDESEVGGEIVMNYGIYNKKIFREIGLYNNAYNYYYSDGDMSNRAHIFGYKHKSLTHIKVCSIITPKVAKHYPQDYEVYKNMVTLYKNKKLPENIEFLT